MCMRTTEAEIEDSFLSFETIQIWIVYLWAASQYQYELLRFIERITVIKDHIMTFSTIQCDKQNVLLAVLSIPPNPCVFNVRVCPVPCFPSLNS